MRFNQALRFLFTHPCAIRAGFPSKELKSNPRSFHRDSPSEDAGMDHAPQATHCAVIATRKGAASVIRDSKSMVLISKSGRGFSQVLLNRRMYLPSA